MILINLLPPELRKRSTTYNPIALAWGGAMAACLLLFLFCAWVHWGKLPEAERIQEEKNEELTTKTAQAAIVQANETKIAELEERKAKLQELIGRKVYWAHTLDDFANLLASDFPGGFHVRCLDLIITPGAEKRGEGPVYSFRGRYQMVGDDKLKAGEYVYAMFRTFRNSTFWKQDGFVGKPEDSYNGDRPTFNVTIGKAINTLNLEFQRAKTLPKPKAGG